MRIYNRVLMIIKNFLKMLEVLSEYVETVLILTIFNALVTLVFLGVLCFVAWDLEILKYLISEWFFFLKSCFLIAIAIMICFDLS